MAEQVVTKQKKPPITRYVATTGLVALTVFTMWFMKSCGPEPIIKVEKAKAPCGCNERPGADTVRIAGPRTGPFGIWRRDTLQVTPVCDTTKKPDTTKCPDSNAHHNSTGDCKCNGGYHNEAKAPDLKCVKNKPPPPQPVPCGCPDELANDVKQSIVDAVKVIALRRNLVHDDKDKIPVIDAVFVVKPNGTDGVVAGPAQFKAKCPGGCEDTTDLASMIPAGVEGMRTDLPPGGKPCTRRFTIPLPP